MELAAVRGEVQGNLGANITTTGPVRTLGSTCRCGQSVLPFKGDVKCAGCEFLTKAPWGVAMMRARVRACHKGLQWT